MSIFSDRITALREARDLTKTDVARHLGISVQAYANYEYGIRETSFELLKIIANFYEVSIDYLLGNDQKLNGDNSHKTISQALSYVTVFNGKDISDHDRKVMKQLIEVYLANRVGD